MKAATNNRVQEDCKKVKAVEERRKLPQAAVCEKIAKRARAATNNHVQEERANVAGAACCGEAKKTVKGRKLP